MIRRPPRSTRTDTLFPYTTLVRSGNGQAERLTNLQHIRLLGSGNATFTPPGRDIGGRLTKCTSHRTDAAEQVENCVRLIPAHVCRSEERRGGKECGSTCRYRRTQYNYNKKKQQINTYR